MTVRTLAQLEQNIRFRWDIKGFEARHPQADIFRLINDAYAALRERLTSDGIDIYCTSIEASAAVTGATTGYSGTILPLSRFGYFTMVLDVHAFVNNAWQKLPQKNMGDASNWQVGNAWPYAWAECGNVDELGPHEGQSLRILITPALVSNVAFRVVGLRPWQPLSGVADVINLGYNEEEFIITSVGAVIATRDEDAASQANARLALREAAYAEIARTLKSRTKQGPVKRPVIRRRAISAITPATAAPAVNPPAIKSRYIITASDESGKLEFTPYNGLAAVGGSAIAFKRFDVGRGAHDVAVDGYGNIWVPLYQESAIARVNAATGNVETKITLGTNSQPTVALWDGSNGIYVGCDSTTNGYVVDIASGLVAQLSVKASSLALDGNRTVYGTDRVAGTCWRIDTVTRLLLGSPITVGAFPKSCAWDGGRGLYVVNSGDNTATKIRIDTFTVEGSPIAVGTNPQSVAWDGGLYMYVANRNSNNISRIAIATSAVDTTISGFTTAMQLLWDGANHMLVLCEGDSTMRGLNIATATWDTVCGLLKVPRGLALENLQ